MTSANASRKAPSDAPTTNGVSKGKKQSASKLADSVASSVRSESPSVNGDAASAEQPQQKGSTGAAPSSQQSEAAETQLCKHCKKHVDKVGFAGHSKQCLRDKKERKRQEEAKAEAAQAAIDAKEKEKDAEGDIAMDDSTISIKPPQRTATNEATAKDDDTASISTPVSATAPKNAKTSKDGGGGNSKNSKKRKADDTPTVDSSGSKPPPKKQKKKEETSKAKAAKPKGPVDVEKQCGVLLPNGQMCARSLTCKSHPMGAKRAVPGRSLPYNVLLQQYQKKNQAKQQKAATAAQKPSTEDTVDPQNANVDSDEERDAVMAAISRAAPRPLYEKPVLGVRAKYNHIRMKEMLSNALGGNRGAGLFATAPRTASGTGSAVIDGTDGWATQSGFGEGESSAAQRRMSGVGMQGVRRGSMSSGVQAW